MMKALTRLALALAVVGMTACSSSDGKENGSGSNVDTDVNVVTIDGEPDAGAGDVTEEDVLTDAADADTTECRDEDCPLGTVCNPEGQCIEADCQFCTASQVCFKKEPDDPGSCSAPECAEGTDCDPGTCEDGLCVEPCEPIDPAEFDEYECSPLCQTGCPDGQGCYFGSNPAVGFTSLCAVPSDAEDGDPCDLTGDGLCAAGLNCTGLATGGQACFKICDLATGEQCDDDETCLGNDTLGTCQ